MATLNIGMKVNRAITGATTVNANAYAMVTYISNGTGSYNSADGNVTTNASASVTRIFGPAQAIPASYTSSDNNINTINPPALISSTRTWTLQSGVELINTQ